jgi:hypothetical protein
MGALKIAQNRQDEEKVDEVVERRQPMHMPHSTTA